MTTFRQPGRFHERLQELASEKNLYQVDLIEIFCRDKSTISKWWNGERVPGPKNMRMIAGYFGCNVSWLASGVGVKCQPGANNTTTNHFPENDIDREKPEVREEKLSPDVKQDLMEMTSEVLDSETVYRPALVSNIRAFHHGARQMSKTDGKVDELMREIAELKQMILGMSPAHGTEKKRAGNHD